MSALSISLFLSTAALLIAGIATTLASLASRLILSAISAAVETALILRIASSRPLLTSAAFVAALTTPIPSSFAFVTFDFKRTFASLKMSAPSISLFLSMAALLIAGIAFDLASSASRLILSAISAAVETALMSRIASSRPLLTSTAFVATLITPIPSSFAFVTCDFKRAFASLKISALSIS